MMELQNWIVALRVKFLTATLVPVAIGTAYASYLGDPVSLPIAILAFLSIGAIQIGANLSNDFFDHLSGNDGKNATGSLFSGGSRAIQNGLLTPKQVIHLAYGFYAAGLLIGLALSIVFSDPIIAILYLSGAMLAYYYCAPPLRLAYRGYAEAANFVAFGPLITMLSYRLQTLQFDMSAFLASIIPGLLLALVLLINEFPDYDADKAAKKRTLVVRVGKKKALKAFFAGLILSYCYLLGLVVSGQTTPYSLAALITLPLAFRIIRNSSVNYDNTQLLSSSNRDTILLHLLFGLVLAGSLIMPKP